MDRGFKRGARRTSCWLAGVALAFALPLQAAETLKYVILVDGGKPAGQQVTVFEDDGRVRTDFIFKDNGRGPELKEEYRLAADGSFSHYRVTGTSTFGAPVDESWTVENGIGRWKSTSDAGEAPQRDGALYWPLGGTAQSFAPVLAALARRGAAGVPLIPSGTMKSRVVDEMTVTQGGKSRRLHLLSMTGVGFTPNFVWTTTDAVPRVFAFIAPGYMQMVEDGWQATANQLEARQKIAESKALVDFNRRLTHRIAGTSLIHNVRLFDSEKGTLSAPSSVLIRDGRILRVGAGNWGDDDHVGHANDLGSVVRMLDGGGRVLLPGLFDAHAHTSRWSGALDIAAGVTSIRDMGNDNATLQQIIAEEKAGTLLGARVVPAGFLEGESKQSARNGFVVSDLAGAKKAIDWYAGHGYPQIKIYNSFPKEILKDTVAYAHAKGLRVSGHIPVFLRAEQAVDAGYDEIQHINQVLLNFLVDDKTDTRTLERFYLPAKKIADLDFDSRPVQDFIAKLVDRKVVVDPTIATFDFIRQRAGEVSPVYAAVAGHMPPDVQRGFKVAEFDIPDAATATRYQKSYDKMIEFIGRMHRAGVPIVAGTDAMPGFSLQRELELYVKAGLSPAQALQTATWNTAKYARVLDDRGSIAVGKRADLILVDGDPTADITDIRQVATVIKGDVVYYPSEVYTELGIRPFAAPVRWNDAVPRAKKK